MTRGIVVIVAVVSASCDVEPSIDHFDAVMATGALVSAGWPNTTRVARWGVHLVPDSEKQNWDWCQRNAEVLSDEFSGFPFNYGVSSLSSFESGGSRTYANWVVLGWVSSSTSTSDSSAVRLGRSSVLTYPEVDPGYCSGVVLPCYGGRIAGVEVQVTSALPPCP